MKKVSAKIVLMNKVNAELVSLKSSPIYNYRIRNNFLPVIGEGSCNAKFMLIGEAPGRNEAKTGKPFCGAAGKILDKLLLHVKIERESVYVTNIVKDRPPLNRDPTNEEIKIYGPLLDEQIAIIKPKVIVALGRYSMKYIMNKFNLESEIVPIGKAHGKSYTAIAPWMIGVGIPVKISIVILYHPCMAIYNPKNLPMLKKDIEILNYL